MRRLCAPLLLLAACRSPTAATEAGERSPGLEEPAPLAKGTASAAGAEEPSPLAWHYTLAIDTALSELRVELCFADRVPALLVPSEALARAYLRRPQQLLASGPTAAASDARGIHLQPSPQPGCVRYAVDLLEAVAGERSMETAMLVGTDLMFSPDLWLWGPESVLMEAQVSASCALPSGLYCSVPWPTVSTRPNGQEAWVVDDSTYRWRTLMAIGHQPPHRIQTAGTSLDVMRLGRPLAASPLGVGRWLSEAARAVSLAGGHFPVPRVQVILLPTRSDEVEFGMIQRGGGPTAVLMIGDRAADSSLPGEWVGVHELSHLLTPFVRAGDAWFSEGLATYYQEVLRARSGLRSEESTWGQLAAGFHRGLKNETGETLADTSESLGDNHDYMRVYWGGAALALLADVALREQSGGRLSLDLAVEQVRGGFTELRRPSGEELYQRMDQATGTQVFSELYRRHVLAKGYPPVLSLLERLGVRADGERVQLDEQAPLAAVRRAITQPKASR